MHFALDLAKDGENFPQKVLALFDKHFGFRRSIFFPYQYPAGGFLGGGPAGQHVEQLHHLRHPLRAHVRLQGPHL